MNHPAVLNFVPLLIWMLAVLWIQNTYEHSASEREDIMYLAILGAILLLIIGVLL